MTKLKNRPFSFQSVFIMLLFFMIVSMSFMIILTGKNIYSSINEDRSTNYEKRVSLSYVANKVRQNDKDGSVKIQSLNGNNAVVIKEQYDDATYETWIYHFDGAIYEMFTDEGSAFNPDDGMMVMEAESFSIEEINRNLYKFTATSNQKSTELVLCLYSN